VRLSLQGANNDMRKQLQAAQQAAAAGGSAEAAAAAAAAQVCGGHCQSLDATSSAGIVMIPCLYMKPGINMWAVPLNSGCQL
jgi:hypothetical protein